MQTFASKKPTQKQVSSCFFRPHTDASFFKSGTENGFFRPSTLKEAGQQALQSPALGMIQAKLTINKPGDEYEQEADFIADKVMRMAQLFNDEYRHLQLKSFQTSNARQPTAPSIVYEVLQSPGQQLDINTRIFMEQRFGYDFSNVRVHTGTSAEQSAKEVNAKAYTVGNNIVFGAGMFAPETYEGGKMLAHELTHVVQQSTSGTVSIARSPNTSPFKVNQQDIVNLRNIMLRFYDLLTPDARAHLHRNTTVVFALVSHGNFQTLVYTQAGNTTHSGIRAAADQLGIMRLDPKGIEKIAGEQHAEQLMREGAKQLGFKVHAMAVTRRPCPDCGPLIANAGIPIEWVRDPNKLTRPPSGSSPKGGTPPPPHSGNTTATSKTEGKSANAPKPRQEVEAASSAHRNTTRGNAGGATYVPNPSTTEPQYAKVSGRLSRLRNFGSNVLSGAKSVYGIAKGPLSAGLELLDAIRLVQMTESALSGGGFVFTRQIEHSEDLAQQITVLVKSYKDLRIHEELNQMVKLAREIDEADSEALYGSDQLSEFCEKIIGYIEEHKSSCEQLWIHMEEIFNEATWRYKAAENLLEDKAFLVMVGANTLSSVIIYELWTAHKDLRQILHTLDLPKSRLKDHLNTIGDDFEITKSNIIGGMLWVDY